MGRQIFSAVTLAVLYMAVLLTDVSGLAAVKHDRFTATWDLPSSPVDRYEFRWKHFAALEWIALPDQPGTATTFTSTFRPLPDEPATDRWMCVDARIVQNEQFGQWLSETPAGAACAAVEGGTIPLPTPPPPVVVPPPMPPQPDIFTNVQQVDGRLSIDYQLGACPRGVQQTTSAIRNGSRTITLSCRR